MWSTLPVRGALGTPAHPGVALMDELTVATWPPPRSHSYPPNKQEKASLPVLEQPEAFSAQWAVARNGLQSRCPL